MSSGTPETQPPRLDGPASRRCERRCCDGQLLREVVYGASFLRAKQGRWMLGMSELSLGGEHEMSSDRAAPRRRGVPGFLCEGPP